MTRKTQFSYHIQQRDEPTAKSPPSANVPYSKVDVGVVKESLESIHAIPLYFSLISSCREYGGSCHNGVKPTFIQSINSSWRLSLGMNMHVSAYSGLLNPDTFNKEKFMHGTL